MNALRSVQVPSTSFMLGAKVIGNGEENGFCRSTTMGIMRGKQVGEEV